MFLSVLSRVDLIGKINRYESNFVIKCALISLSDYCNIKTATCFYLTKVRSQDGNTLETLKQSFSTAFNERFADLKKSWGRIEQGMKTQHRLEKKARSEL